MKNLPLNAVFHLMLQILGICLVTFFSFKLYGQSAAYLALGACLVFLTK